MMKYNSRLFLLTCKLACVRYHSTMPWQICLHSVHQGINPLFSCQAPPPWISKLSKPPFQGNPPLILVFRDPPPKSQISHWTPKILKFFILNTIFFFKVTEFLVKISQFKYLVITERNIFACKLFLSLNISDFIFYVKIANLPCPLKKVTLLLPSNPLLKVEVLSSPAIFENLVGGSIAPPPRQQKGGRGVCTLWVMPWWLIWNTFCHNKR